jgi:cation diffusion facilitator CzcD-associated flavoprotein CzcO
VQVSTAKGSKDAEFCGSYEISTDFLVSAVGQLNVPKWPNIPGIEGFGGRVMHSARWDWSCDLEGKRIAVIGNGKLVTSPFLTLASGQSNKSDK